MNEEKKSSTPLGNSPMIKVAAFIVDKRNLFFLLFGIAVLFSLVGSQFVKVENDLAAYLPNSAETSIGLDLMEDQFTTYGSAKVMAANLSYEEAKKLSDKIDALDYVSLVQFDDSPSHYNDFSALYSVTFPYNEDDDRSLEALEKLKTELSDYDIFVSTTMGDQTSASLAEEMKSIIFFVAIIVVGVLLFTSTSYAEVPVLIVTFLASAALAAGTNFLLGTISFVSNSVAIVLQLALSVDYAVIFSNRYKDEHKSMDARSADIIALSKAIPEISASSLTTIGGLIAMGFMQFGIGPDLAVVLIKAIFLSLLSVFLLMPGLIMLFADLMDRTVHKNFVPSIPFVGKFAYATRFFIPPVFILIMVFAFRLSNDCPYAYGDTLITTPVQSEQQKVNQLIDTTFGTDNMVAMIVPAGNYETEARLIRYLERCPEVKSVTGLANTDAMDGTTLTQKLNARQFSELLDVDKELATVLYTAYAVDSENYAKLLTGIEDYSIPFIDVFQFLYREVQEGYVSLDDEINEQLESANSAITVAQNQLQGSEYSRFLVFLNLPEEGEETFAFLDRMHALGHLFYGEEADIYVVGNSTSQYDLCKTFKRDNNIVNIISVMAVLVVLLFTFKSCGMPLLLIIVIEGCIWMNFSFPTITHTYLFFLSYLVVSSIQMGANIDYAIVVSSRYQEVKGTMTQREAIIDAMNFAFPTIITSGTMLASAGILIGNLTSMPSICGVGQCLGRGTIISIIAVLFVLPQILLVGDKLIDKSTFDVNLPLPATPQKTSGTIRIDGMVNGRVNGFVIGTMHAVVWGNINAQVISGGMTTMEEPEEVGQRLLTETKEDSHEN